MSELDRIYQEFYEQVTAKIWADYEDFKVKKADYYPKAQIEKFQYLLLSICGNFSRSYENPEIEKTNYLFTEFNHFRTKLVEYFRRDTKKYRNYQRNPVDNFLEEENLEKIVGDSGYPSVMPSKEILARTLAFYDAYIDVYEQLKTELENENSISIMSTKQTLLQWLAEGENERVVDALQYIAERFGDKYFKVNATSIIGQFNGLKRDRKQGIISDEFYTIQLNRIRQALQSLIDEVPSNATLPISVESTIVNSQENVPMSDTNQPKTTDPKILENTLMPATRYVWISAVGLLVTVALFILLTSFADQLNVTQNDRAYYILLFPLAFSAAAFLFGAMRTYASWTGNVLNGTLEMGGPIVLATGIVLGGFLLPGNIEPFEFTINLQQDRNIRLSNQYPKLENATLQIWIGNDWRDARIDVNNLARYFSLPGDYKDQKVAVQLLGKYWTVQADSVQLSGKSQTLTIAPDGTLGTVQGKVSNINGDNFLKDVIIEVTGEKDTTDASGNFQISIPLEKQREQYELIATKPGYSVKRQFVYPTPDKMEDIRLTKNQ